MQGLGCYYCIDYCYYFFGGRGLVVLGLGALRCQVKGFLVVEV